MNVDRNNMSCADFQGQLAELIGSGEDVANHPHLRTCETCQALLSDLQTIADAARKLLPVDSPKEDLWDRIQLAIQADDGTLEPE